MLRANRHISRVRIHCHHCLYWKPVDYFIGQKYSCAMIQASGTLLSNQRKK